MNRDNIINYLWIGVDLVNKKFRNPSQFYFMKNISLTFFFWLLFDEQIPLHLCSHSFPPDNLPMTTYIQRCVIITNYPYHYRT